MSNKPYDWTHGSSYFGPEERGRGLKQTEGSEGYEETLGFKAEDLEGKKVLDLGSGPKERLSKDLQNRGITVDLVAINPDLGIWSTARRDLIIEPYWEKKSIAAVGQALPFKTGTFDEVLALYSVSWYTSPEDDENEEAAKLWAKEIVRVLKKGGKARIFPVSKWPKRDEQRFRDIFTGLGVEITINELDSGLKRAIITKQVGIQEYSKN